MSSNGEDFGDALDRAQSGGGGGSADDDQNIPDDSPFADVVDRVSGAVDTVTDAVDDATGGGGGGGSGIRERAEQVADTVSDAVGDVTGEDEQTGSKQQSESRSTAERLADASENIEDARDARLRAEAQSIADSADPALEQARRRVARQDIAQELDQQVGQDIGAGDVRVQQSDDGLRGSLRSNVQQDLARSRAVDELDDQTSTDITADDVTVQQTDDGVRAELDEDAAKTVGARRRGLAIASELSEPDITVQDVGREAAAVGAVGATPEPAREAGLSDDAPQAVREALEGQPTGPTVGGSLEEAMPTQRSVGRETIAPGALREPDTPDSVREAVVEAPETGAKNLMGVREASVAAADTFQRDIVRPTGGLAGSFAERGTLQTLGELSQAEDTEEFESELSELTTPDTSIGQGTAEAVRGAGSVGSFGLRAPATAIDIGRTGVQAGSVLEEEVSEDGAGGVADALGRGGSAAVDAGGEVVSSAAERPVFTASSLLATGGAIGAASRISRGAGLATETAIQPGAVAATGAARGTIGRTATGARVLNRIPGDRIAAEEVVLGTAAGGARRAAAAGRTAGRLRNANIELSPSPRQQEFIDRVPGGADESLAGTETTVFDGDEVLTESAIETQRQQAASARAPGNVEESAGDVLDALDTQAPTRTGQSDPVAPDIETTGTGSDNLPLQSEIQEAGGTRQFIRGEELPGRRISDAEVPSNLRQFVADESAKASLVGRQRQRQEPAERPDFRDFSEQRQDALDLRRQLQSDIDARTTRRLDESRSRVREAERPAVDQATRSRLDALADARASARGASILDEEPLSGAASEPRVGTDTDVNITPDQRSSVFADVVADVRPQARQRTDLGTAFTGEVDLGFGRPDGGGGRGDGPRTDTPIDPGTELTGRPDVPRQDIIDDPLQADVPDDDDEDGLFASEEVFSSGIASADDILESDADDDGVDLL